MIEVEQLREALASAKQVEAALNQRLREQDLVLSGLQAVMNADNPAVLMTLAFDLLREAVAFESALVLRAEERGFVCTDATDASAIGRAWPDGGFFRRVADGRPAVVPANLRIPEWNASDYQPPAGAGLYAPIPEADGAGLLIVCADGHGRYSAKDLALATRFSLLISQCLAARQRRVLAEAARKASFDRLAAVEASEAKSRFLATMSHEIRTPLNGITTVADLLNDSELTDRQSEMVGLIRSSGRMLEGLLNDVLDFAKIESGKLTIERRPFDLSAALASVFDLFAAKADEKGLQFVTEIEPAARGVFEGDDLRIRQVVGNLLSNAVKFTHAGSVRVRVSASDDAQGTAIAITVTDTGVGFSAATAGRLFSLFEQGEAGVTRAFGGSGLGLAISRSLAEMMQGAIECRGEPGAGAAFVFRFRTRRKVLPEQRRRIRPTPSRGLRVLVAEDNPVNQKIVAMILEAIGAAVVFVENGEAALAALAAGRFDVVLMDLQMPVMDGITATKRLRASERTTSAPRTPVIALSANAMTHHVAEALEAGADAHVSKPIDMRRLIGMINSLCGAGGAGLSAAAAPLEAGGAPRNAPGDAPVA